MKKVALIHDLSGLGKCSLTAAIPVISVMGIQTCPLPTAILSAQTGFKNYFYDDYTDQMKQISDKWLSMDVHFDGIYSGFLGNANQMQNVISFLDAFKKPDTIYIADPVLGDHGVKYPIFTDQLLNCMRQLCERADYITPNLTELCLLADTSYDAIKELSVENTSSYLHSIEEVCQRLIRKANCSQTIIVTGVHTYNDGIDYVGNLAVSSNESFYECTPYTGISFSGTGDLFTSAVCGGLMNGLCVKDSVKKATSFLIPAIEEATKEGIDPRHGVNFEKYLEKLITRN